MHFYNYEEIATPLVEHIQIFNRSLGETSDIVSKEMYNFKDQGDDHLVLRPEGTAAVLEHTFLIIFSKNW